MKSVETYLYDIQDKLCDKIVHHWEDDQRFANQREMQQYNCGIAEAMEIIRNVLDGREFKSPLLQSMKAGGTPHTNNEINRVKKMIEEL